jgi:hypothetical protein
VVVVGAAILRFVLALDAPAAAPSLPPPLPPPPGISSGPPETALRANAVAEVFDFVGIGVEVEHAVNRTVALEASANLVTFEKVDSGFYGEALARAGHFGVRNSVSFGLGPGFLYTPDFGRVAFVVPELAYELHGHGQASFLTGFGVPVALNQSRASQCPSQELLGCLFDRLQYQRGDVSIRFRIALGYAF